MESNFGPFAASLLAVACRRNYGGTGSVPIDRKEKFGQHQPPNRQAEPYAKEGVPLSLSTLADQVGGCTAALTPLFKRLEAQS